MSTRASILLWSAGSGAVLGLILDAMIVGAWMVASSFIPAIAPRNFPRWAMVAAVVTLTAIPLLACVLGYLEGRLKVT